MDQEISVRGWGIVYAMRPIAFQGVCVPVVVIPQFPKRAISPDKNTFSLQSFNISYMYQLTKCHVSSPNTF